MHWLVSIAVLFPLTIAPVVAIAESPQIPSTSRGATEDPESVRVQPRGRNFAPNSAQDDEVQRRITIFNATQAVKDAAVDRRLGICRRRC
jgi:hypothetical protein